MAQSKLDCVFGRTNLPCMNKKSIVIFLALCISGWVTNAQTKPYVTSGGELIFSGSNYEDGGAVRFSPVINIQNLVNFDKSQSFGWFTGLNVRNVGLIYDEPGGVRIKARTYNLGIPVGLKVGNLEGKFIYFGYELEIPLNYKEKLFVNEDKEDKFNTWFSARTPSVYHTLMVGIQLPYGSNIKFKYYLTNFFDDDYHAEDQDGNPITYPDVNIFYVSLNYALFKNDKFYYTHSE